MALTGKQSRHLRGLGHHLEALVHIGKDGVTDGVAGAVDAALTTHELVKVRLNPEATADRDESAAAIAKAVNADVAQVLGRTILLYRRHPSEPKINLPRGG